MRCHLKHHHYQHCQWYHQYHHCHHHRNRTWQENYCSRYKNTNARNNQNESTRYLPINKWIIEYRVKKVPRVSGDKRCQGCLGQQLRRSTRGQGFLKNSFQIELDSWRRSILFHIDIGCLKCLEPKGCPQKKLKYVFWSRGQKWKFQTWSNCAEILHGFVGSKYKLF